MRAKMDVICRNCKTCMNCGSHCVTLINDEQEKYLKCPKCGQKSRR